MPCRMISPCNCDLEYEKKVLKCSRRFFVILNAAFLFSVTFLEFLLIMKMVELSTHGLESKVSYIIITSNFPTTAYKNLILHYILLLLFAIFKPFLRINLFRFCFLIVKR